jgi:hypothetical protein
MPVYHQMGHDSKNLLDVPELDGYQGAILSPVNYSEREIIEIVQGESSRANFEIIFDPQLYFPKSQRNILRSWQYFPADVDTADYSSQQWWDNLCHSLASTASRIQPNTVCSPAIVPRNYGTEYYRSVLSITEMLSDCLTNHGIQVIQTLLINLHSLSDYQTVMSIASIVTSTPVRRVYLVFESNTNPRHELADPEELKGGMLLISTLRKNGIEILVSYCSSDMVLWKHAGATSVASGKYFNLRRFTPSRWDESEEGGGGQQAYWLEEALLTFLRASDITRIERLGIISDSSKSNPFSNSILECLKTGQAWLGTSWRFYLWWFYNIDERLSLKQTNSVSLLEQADRNWAIVDERRVYMEERRNNGGWIRQWLRAISEFTEPW